MCIRESNEDLMNDNISYFYSNYSNNTIYVKLLRAPNYG